MSYLKSISGSNSILHISYKTTGKTKMELYTVFNGVKVDDTLNWNYEDIWSYMCIVGVTASGSGVVTLKVCQKL